MDKKVCQKILDTKPSRIIYLSCNPSTQARDVAMLSEEYKITYSRGYNFFPRTPHIENLVVLDLNSTYTRN
jgi:23S rRNA (uracil1939-C5)-methyltransferase